MINSLHLSFIFVFATFSQPGRLDPSLIPHLLPVPLESCLIANSTISQSHRDQQSLSHRDCHPSKLENLFSFSRCFDTVDGHWTGRLNTEFNMYLLLNLPKHYMSKKLITVNSFSCHYKCNEILIVYEALSVHLGLFEHGVHLLPLLADQLHQQPPQL